MVLNGDANKTLGDESNDALTMLLQGAVDVNVELEGSSVDLGAITAGAKATLYAEIDGDDTKLAFAATVDYKLSDVCSMSEDLQFICDYFGESSYERSTRTVQAYIGPGGMGIEFIPELDLRAGMDPVSGGIGPFSFDLTFGSLFYSTEGEAAKTIMTKNMLDGLNEPRPIAFPATFGVENAGGEIGWNDELVKATINFKGTVSTKRMKRHCQMFFVRNSQWPLESRLTI